MTMRATAVLMVVLGVSGVARGQCNGDFNADGMVSINELVTAVENALSGCGASDRFVDNGDGTVTDRQTGLMWERKIRLDGMENLADPHDADNTYQWSGQCQPTSGENFCQPTAASMAACPAGASGCGSCPSGQTCEALPSGRPSVFEWIGLLNSALFAGHGDWRVPTLSELESLADRGREMPAIDPAFVGSACGAGCADATDPTCGCTTSLFYWTSTPTVSEHAKAWSVRFDIGAVDAAALYFNLNVRAVRIAQ